MKVPEVDIDEAARRIDSGAPLIDVRQPDEYAEIRVPGGQLLPLDEVPDRWGEVPTGREVLVICRSGARSGKAVEFLNQRGLRTVNVAGGTLAWVESGRPVERGPDAG